MTNDDKTPELRRHRLARLDDLDEYEVADGDPDIRGWEVIAGDGTTLGRIDELIVDPDALKVRYIDIDADDSLAGDEKDRHLLMPIGIARLDEKDDKVLMPRMTGDLAASCPTYMGGPIERDYETAVWRSLNPGGTPPEGDALYNEELFDERRPFASRRPASDQANDKVVVEHRSVIRKRPNE